MIVKLIFRIINIASTQIRLSDEPFHRYGGEQKLVGGMVGLKICIITRFEEIL